MLDSPMTNPLFFGLPPRSPNGKDIAPGGGKRGRADLPFSIPFSEGIPLSWARSPPRFLFQPPRVSAPCSPVSTFWGGSHKGRTPLTGGGDDGDTVLPPLFLWPRWQKRLDTFLIAGVEKDGRGSKELYETADSLNLACPSTSVSLFFFFQG